MSILDMDFGSDSDDEDFEDEGIDSDSDTEESEDEPKPKTPRSKPVVDSEESDDDSESDEEPKPKTPRSKPVVDSEESDEEPKPKTPRSKPVDSSSDDSDSEGSGSEVSDISSPEGDDSSEDSGSDSGSDTDSGSDSEEEKVVSDVESESGDVEELSDVESEKDEPKKDESSSDDDSGDDSGSDSGDDSSLDSDSGSDDGDDSGSDDDFSESGSDTDDDADDVSDDDLGAIIDSPDSFEDVVSRVEERKERKARKSPARKLFEEVEEEYPLPKVASATEESDGEEEVATPPVKKGKEEKLSEYQIDHRLAQIAKEQKAVMTAFSQYFIKPRKNLTMDELCSKTEFKLQPQQLFAASYISKKTGAIRILNKAGIGSGKTCTFIQILEANLNRFKPLVVVPASLRTNVYKELMSQCAGERFITLQKRTILDAEGLTTDRGRKIWNDSIAKIDRVYKIVSYKGFMDMLKNSRIRKTLKDYLIIIDEVQNVISETGKMYKEFSRFASKHPEVSMVMFSATPIFDHPRELALTINILKPGTFTMSQFDKTFIDNSDPENPTLKNEKMLQARLAELSMYYSGAPIQAYPNVTYEKVNCEMSDFQYNIYTKYEKRQDYGVGIKLANDFYINTRAASNFVYPSGDIKGSYSSSDLADKSLAKYSCKMAVAIKNIESINAPQYIFSNFNESNGTKQIVQTLLSRGWRKYDQKGKGPAFAVFTGAEKDEEKARIVALYKNAKNRDGSMLRLVVASPAMTEGVSLTGTRGIHIFDPYWNPSQQDQVQGRGIRYCSNAHLPEGQRDIKVFLYVATSKKLREDDKQSTDEYLYSLAARKQKLITQFNNVLHSVAIDCLLFNNGNDGVKCVGHTSYDDIEDRYDTGGVDSPTNRRNFNDAVSKDTPVRTPSSSGRKKPAVKRRPRGSGEQSMAGTIRGTKGSPRRRAVTEDGKSLTSCPKPRRLVNNKCPSTHPHALMNKQGVPCCYAKPVKTLQPVRFGNQKSSGKKSPAKKSPAKKSPVRKSPVRNQKSLSEVLVVNDRAKGILVNSRKCENYTKDQLEEFMKKLKLRLEAHGKRKYTKKQICDKLSAGK